MSVHEEMERPERSAEIATPARLRFQRLFDAEQLIILGDAITATCRSRLDLTRVDRNREVGDGGVLSFPTAMANHGSVAGAMCHLNAVERLSERTDLVHLDQDTVRGALSDPSP